MNLPEPVPILFILEPGPKSKDPENDYLTFGMERLMQSGIQSTVEKTYSCSCGFAIQGRNVILDGAIAHPLSVHYLRWHRDAVPLNELGKVFFQMHRFRIHRSAPTTPADPEQQQWSFDNQVYTNHLGMEVEGTLNVRRSADGIILDFVDSDGNIEATNGLDLDCLIGMLQPN